MRLEDLEVLDDREQLEREDYEATSRRQREAARAFDRRTAQLTHQATIATTAVTFTVAPIPGRQSVFYCGEQYLANEEDARRARLELAAKIAREAARLVAVRARLAHRSARRAA